MFAYDTNIWDLLAMPFGVVICFGPALCVWLWKELHNQPPEKRASEPPAERNRR